MWKRWISQCFFIPLMQAPVRGSQLSPWQCSHPEVGKSGLRSKIDFINKKIFWLKKVRHYVQYNCNHHKLNLPRNLIVFGIDKLWTETSFQFYITKNLNFEFTFDANRLMFDDLTLCILQAWTCSWAWIRTTTIYTRLLWRAFFMWSTSDFCNLLTKKHEYF